MLNAFYHVVMLSFIHITLVLGSVELLFESKRTLNLRHLKIPTKKGGWGRIMLFNK
jgi:hypothetical protein